MFTAACTLGAGWKTLSCCAGGSDAYKGITTMGPQLSGRCLAMSRHVLARASISSWPVMKTKMSWDGGASCVQTKTLCYILVLRRILVVHEQHAGKIVAHRFLLSLVFSCNTLKGVRNPAHNECTNVDAMRGSTLKTT